MGSRGETGSDGQKSDTGSDGKLTPRQLTILAEMRRGKTNEAIAVDLDYSESLIRQVTVSIFRKMGVTNRKALFLTSDIP